jgi:hypothetical protein
MFKLNPLYDYKGSYKYQFCKQKILEYAISIYPDNFQMFKRKSYYKYSNGVCKREMDKIDKFLKDQNIPEIFHYQVIGWRSEIALYELRKSGAIVKVGKGRTNKYQYNPDYKYNTEVFSMENFPDLIIYSPIKK